MINSYLTGNAQLDDHSIHLLFSANRWEAIGGILDIINGGETVVVDRYSFSGAVYSAAKDNDNLSLQWGRFCLTASVNSLTDTTAWACEAGLPKPDLVLFLELSSAQAAERGGYGEERYETQKMQTRVRTLFDELFVKLPTVNVRRMDAGQDIETVAAEIMKVVNDTGTDPSLLNKALDKFEFIAS